MIPTKIPSRIYTRILPKIPKIPPRTFLGILTKNFFSNLCRRISGEILVVISKKSAEGSPEMSLQDFLVGIVLKISKKSLKELLRKSYFENSWEYLQNTGHKNPWNDFWKNPRKNFWRNLWKNAYRDHRKIYWEEDLIKS